MARLTRREVLIASAGAVLAPLRRAASSPATVIAPSGRPIAESGFVRIGGIEQWISIRGRNVNNPVIVFLHGGFGDANSPFLSVFEPWERDFTVVTWDERGSGKTYGRYGDATPGMPTPEAALETLTRDAIEVVQYARRRLHCDRVVLVGHSCGSVLALNAFRRGQDQFHAYVGTGFIANWPLMIQAREAWVRKQAQRRGDDATLAALDAAAGKPIGDLQRFIIGQDYLMPPSDLAYLKMEDEFIRSSAAANKADAANWLAGFRYSQERVFPAVSSFDERAGGLDFERPFFVIQGRDDHVTSFEAAKAYMADVRAPRKEFVAIDGGHFACFMKPEGFLTALHTLLPSGAHTAG